MDSIVEALLAASRVLVGLAARSLAEIKPEVTLPQFRTLVVLAARGPQRLVDVAAELAVSPSTGTRMCDRLTRKGLIRRYRSGSDRRSVHLTLTPAGRTLVNEVTRQRRAQLARIVAATAEEWPPEVARALHAFAVAAGEAPEPRWWLGWPGHERNSHDDGDVERGAP
ncbi:MarR family winged helix-turn-helix transcriptional regulator [Planosporangium thailandense]|nr:MarR family transcriptional regulator [Planosporangium thailandense]